MRARSRSASRRCAGCPPLQRVRVAGVRGAGLRRPRGPGLRVRGFGRAVQDAARPHCVRAVAQKGLTLPLTPVALTPGRPSRLDSSGGPRRRLGLALPESAHVQEAVHRPRPPDVRRLLHDTIRHAGHPHPNSHPHPHPHLTRRTTSTSRYDPSRRRANEPPATRLDSPRPSSSPHPSTLYTSSPHPSPEPSPHLVHPLHLISTPFHPHTLPLSHPSIHLHTRPSTFTPFHPPSHPSNHLHTAGAAGLLRFARGGCLPRVCHL
eukprot:1664520-Prymnesium_polylepis.1